MKGIFWLWRRDLLQPFCRDRTMLYISICFLAFLIPRLLFIVDSCYTYWSKNPCRIQKNGSFWGNLAGNLEFWPNLKFFEESGLEISRIFFRFVLNAHTNIACRFYKRPTGFVGISWQNFQDYCKIGQTPNIFHHQIDDEIFFFVCIKCNMVLRFWPLSS